MSYVLLPTTGVVIISIASRPVVIFVSILVV